MSGTRKQTWLAVMAAFALAAGTACSDSHAADKPDDADTGAPTKLTVGTPVSVATAGEHEVDRFILTGGKIAFDDINVAHVFSPVTGRVTSILAALGAHVKKGQPLATIASPDLSMALSDEDKAKADLTAAEHELARQKELYAAHAGAQRDLEGAQDDYQKAAAELARAKEKARLLSAGGSANVRQEYVLTSPIDGEVIARSLNPGIEVQGQYSGGATLELFTIGKLDRVWVMADVYEQDIARVKLGAPVQLSLVAYPGRTFVGKVDWISGALDPTTHTAKVRCTLQNPDRLLKPEMYVTARIEAEGRTMLAVPRSAILHLGDKTVVYVASNDSGTKDSFVRRPVIVDEALSGDWVPVLHGISPGERIVTSGAILLSEVVN